MLTHLYAVRDSKVNEYNSPYSLANDLIAKRVLESSVNDTRKSLLTQFPQDYDLYKIGSYDSVSGEIVPCKPEFIVSAASLKKLNDGRNESLDV